MSDQFVWPDGRRAALSLTFDDARASQAELAIPLFRRYGIHATFYVNPSAVEQRPDDWRVGVHDGHEIGNHTDSHPCSGNFPFSRANALEDYSIARLERDILEANERVRQLLGVDPKTFAYPCGQKFVGRGTNTQSYVPVVARHFLVGRGAFDETHNDPAYVDLAQITAVDIDGASFERIASLVEGARDTGGWLVLFGHEVGAEARQTIPLDSLARLCEWLQDSSSGVWCDTVHAVGSYVSAHRADPTHLPG